MTSQKIYSRRNGIILFVVALSIILYFAGVLSGLYANRLIKEQTEKDIRSFKKETESYLASLQGYVSFLDTNLKNMQLEQTFIETLDRDQLCNFLNLSMGEMVKQLQFYWSKLPYRIEEYEKNNELSEEYLALKQQYLHLSIRTWIIAKSQYEKCDIDIVHGLYFYSKDCDKCVKQGEQIDRFNKKVSASGSSLIMFPIDFNSEESIIKNLKKYYNITSTPAIVVNDKVSQGRLFTAEELMKYPTRN